MSSTVREDLKLRGLLDLVADVWSLLLQSPPMFEGDCDQVYYMHPGHLSWTPLSKTDGCWNFSDFKAEWFCCTSYGNGTVTFPGCMILTWINLKSQTTGTKPLFGAAPGLTNDTVSHQSKVVLWGDKIDQHDLIIQLVAVKLSNLYCNFSKPCFFRTNFQGLCYFSCSSNL